MKKLFTLILMLVLANFMYAQEVVSTAGESYSNSGYEVSWTIGEPIINTLSSGNTILTQGFHQSKLIITAINEIADLKNLISVFPNPTYEYAIVKFNTLPEQNTYKLYDLSGKIIESKKIKSTETKIDLMKFAQGTYLLKIMQTDGELVQTFKIIKQ